MPLNFRLRQFSLYSLAVQTIELYQDMKSSKESCKVLIFRGMFTWSTDGDRTRTVTHPNKGRAETKTWMLLSPVERERKSSKKKKKKVIWHWNTILVHAVYQQQFLSMVIIHYYIIIAIRVNRAFCPNKLDPRYHWSFSSLRLCGSKSHM